MHTESTIMDRYRSIWACEDKAIRGLLVMGSVSNYRTIIYRRYEYRD